MATYTYRLRVRNAADSADALTVTSVTGGTNPYISEPPSGDGQGFNPRTGETQVGAYTVRIADNGSAANAITGFLADANSRYDKLGRRAYLEYGTDGVTFPNLLVAGYVTGISYPSAAEAMVSVGEAQRAERTKQAFSVATTTFPATRRLGGGQVRWPSGVSVLPVNWPNRGPWTMKRFDTSGASGVVNLIFVSGYVLKDDKAVEYTLATNGAMPSYMARRINTLVSTEVPGAAVGPTAGIYRVGNVYADVYAAGVLVGTFQVVAERPDLTIGNQVFLELEWTSAAATNTEYQVYLYTKTVSENNPLHLLMHPVDVVTGLIDDAGELWDTTTAATVKASIGADVRVFLRVTRSETTDAAIARLMGLFGFGRRMNSANKWEFFDQRTKTTTAPSVTIALDDLREIPPKVWDLNDSTILNNITVVAERFAIWAPGQSSTRPPDSLVPVEQKRTARFQLADGTYPDTSQGVKELTYEIQGTILNASGAEANLTDFTNALAAPAFDRWGYGAPSMGLICRATIGAGANIGDEVLLNLNYLPNANVRGGQQIAQIVQRTNEPGGPVLQVEYAGLSAQPSLAPTFTIVASTANVYAQADIALTNAAALVAAGVVSVVVEWQVSVLTPAIAGQDLGAIVPVGPVTLTTPQVPAGSKVWARCKSIQPGKRSGTFTSWAGVTLSGVGTPAFAALTADPLDGSKGTFQWSAGTNSAGYTVRLLLRLTGLPAASDVPVVDLKPGSTAFPFTGLTPGANYQVTIQYVDPNTGIVASSVGTFFTAGSTIYVLPMPVYPAGIVGSTDGNGVGHVDGTYGLDVTASELPGTIEFWEQTELATGGFASAASATLVASAPAVNGDVTSYRNVAPHDSLRRRLTARHVRTGTTSSDYTAPIDVDPWGTVHLPSSIPSLSNFRWSDSSTSRTYTWTRSASTDTVWIYDRLVLVGAPAGWPSPTTPPSSLLLSGVDSYVATIPPKLYQRFIQVEPRDADLSVGEVRRTFIDAPAPLTLKGSATIIAADTTTITVQLTVTDPAGTAVVSITLASAGVPAVAYSALGSNQWQLTRPAWNSTSGRVTFEGSAPGRETIVVPVTVPPQTSAVAGGKPRTWPGAAFQPKDGTTTGYRKFNNYDLYSNTGGVISFNGVCDTYLPDGVTMTQFTSKTISNGAAAVATIKLLKVAQVGGAVTTLATHTNTSGTGLEVTNNTTISEVVDNTTYYYYSTALLTPDPAGGLGLSEAILNSIKVTYSSPDLSKGY